MSSAWATTTSGRCREIAEEGKRMLDAEGPDGLSMRRLAQRVGVTAPALYRYFPDKSALEVAIIAAAYAEIGERCAAEVAVARRAGDDDLLALVRAYVDWAREHPHLYRLVYCSPLSGQTFDLDAVRHRAGRLREVCGGDVAAAGSIWLHVHGALMLELDGRLTETMVIDELLARGIARLRPVR